MMAFVRSIMTVKRFVVMPMLAELAAVIVAIIIIVKSEADITIQMIRLPLPTSPLPILRVKVQTLFNHSTLHGMSICLIHF